MWLPTAPICALNIFLCVAYSMTIPRDALIFWDFVDSLKTSTVILMNHDARVFRWLFRVFWMWCDVPRNNQFPDPGNCPLQHRVVTALVCVWSCQCHGSVTHGVTRSLITFWLWQYSCSKIKWTVNYLLRPEFSIKHAKVLMSEYNRNLFIEFDLLTHIKLSLIVLLHCV